MKHASLALVLVLALLFTAAVTLSASIVTPRCDSCRPTLTATFESRWTPTFTPDTGRITPTPDE